MAVNGIEIKVGQVWRTRGGTCVTIIAHDVGNPTDPYPWRIDTGCSEYVTDEGGYWDSGKEDGLDLVELISETNEPQEIRFEPGDASTLAIEMLTDLGWVFTEGVWVQEQPLAERQTAADLLGKAAGHMAARAATYDQPGGERSMGKTVSIFNIFTGHNLTESEGWLLMQVLKDVRDRQRAEPHADSLEDGIAYSALKAEARLAEKQKE